MRAYDTHSEILGTDENGAYDGTVLATVIRADETPANAIAAAPAGAESRSPWLWVRFQNGGLMLGCFPQGDAYEIVAQRDPKVIALPAFITEPEERLKPFYVLPYTVHSDGYGDYEYTNTHDDDGGELVAANLPGLEGKLAELMQRLIGAWGVAGKDERSDSLTRRAARFKGVLECFDNYKGQERLESAPEYGLRYPKFGALRMELRKGDGARPLDLAEEADRGMRGACGAAREALGAAHDALLTSAATRADAAAAASLVTKRAQLERLKAELGES